MKQRFPNGSYSLKKKLNTIAHVLLNNIRRTRTTFPAPINMEGIVRDGCSSVASVCFLYLCRTDAKSCLLVPES